MKTLDVKWKIVVGVMGALFFYLLMYIYSKPKDPIDLNQGIVKEIDVVKDVYIADKEMVQVRFSWQVGGVRYNDALNITKDEYKKLTPLDIEQMKEERFKSWVKTVNDGSKK